MINIVFGLVVFYFVFKGLKVAVQDLKDYIAKTVREEIRKKDGE